MPGGGYGHSGCVCVHMPSDMGTGGSGMPPMPPTGTGSGSGPTGSPPTGGNGTGPIEPESENVTVPEIWWDFMTTDETPTPGPELDSVYQPGTPGAPWTKGEVAATRMRVLQMIHPDWNVKKQQGTWNGVGSVTEIGQVKS